MMATTQANVISSVGFLASSPSSHTRRVLVHSATRSRTEAAKAAVCRAGTARMHPPQAVRTSQRSTRTSHIAAATPVPEDKIPKAPEKDVWESDVFDYVFKIGFVALCVAGVVLFLSLGEPVLKIMSSAFPTIAPDQY